MRGDNLRAHREAVARMHANREEDVRWMLDGGECLTGVAARLGIRMDALEKWLVRRGMLAELARLRARDPFDPTRSLSESGRIGAAARWSA